MKHLNLTILALLLSFASFAQVAAITGPSGICLGTAVTYSDATSGGSWSSSASFITIDPITGVGTGISAGVATISYTVGASYATYSVTVEPLPSPIAGSTAVCADDTIMPSDPTPGGTWTLSPLSVATISVFGVVTGIAAGTATLTYTSAMGCYVTRVITVNPYPAPIAGTPTVCVGGTTTLTEAGGGIWSSAAPVVASVGSASGVVTGYSSGSVAISYILGTGCSTHITVTVSPAPAAFTVTGGGSYCLGGSGVAIGLSNSSIGCTYQLFYGGVLVGSPLAGTGATLSFGVFTAAGTYTVVANYGTGCATVMTGAAVVVVNTLPTVYSITGGGPYCSGGAGDDIMLSGSDLGIAYQLYSGGAPVGALVAGTGGPIDFGYQTAAGTYTITAINTTTGCADNMSGSAVVSIATSVTPSVAITEVPGLTVCAGTTVAYTANPTNGGTTPTYAWTVNGVAAGTSGTYSYIPANGDVVGVMLTSDALCASPTTAATTVVMTVDVPTVTATASTASCGGVVTLTGGGATTYSWSPSTGLSCGTCAIATLSPTATTIYTVTGTDGTGCTGTAAVSVDGNSISGYISYTGTPSAGDFKVWLIQFNPSDSSITSTDSTVNCVDAGTAYYQFMDEPTGSYMVKTKLNSSVPGTSGWVPTYSLSSPTWDLAATISHTGGADNMNVTMIYGTEPSGPGFIAGYVLSGAGRNTSTDVPAAGMTIYLKNAAGSMVTYTTTAADGTYSFSNLAYGGYYVYPESYKDYTTASALITLAPGTDTVSAIDFKKHTDFNTITPYNNTKVNQPVLTTTGLNIFPNPTTGNLNIQWTKQSIGNANVVLTDMIGREVFNTTLDINTPSGQTMLDLGTLNNGIYMITIKADNLYYSGRLVRMNN